MKYFQITEVHPIIAKELADAGYDCTQDIGRVVAYSVDPIVHGPGETDDESFVGWKGFSPFHFPYAKFFDGDKEECFYFAVKGQDISEQLAISISSTGGNA